MRHKVYQLISNLTFITFCLLSISLSFSLLSNLLIPTFVGRCQWNFFSVYNFSSQGNDFSNNFLWKFTANPCFWSVLMNRWVQSISSVFSLPIASYQFFSGRSIFFTVLLFSFALSYIQNISLPEHLWQFPSKEAIATHVKVRHFFNLLITLLSH